MSRRIRSAYILLCFCAAGLLGAQEPLPLPNQPPTQTQNQDQAPELPPPPGQAGSQDLPLPSSQVQAPTTAPAASPAPAQAQAPQQAPVQAPTPAPAAVPTEAQIEARIHAQSQQAAQPGAEPTLKENPLEALRDFEPSADEEYRLGKGDAITVDFAGRPDLAAKLIIGPDGRITLPLAGDIMLDGLTRAGAAKAIDTALAPYYSNLVVTVTVTAYTANRVVLLGAVDHPGTITFDGTPTLLEALARGGVQAGPDKSGSGQGPDVEQIPERCAIYRGNDQVIWVELRKLVETGNALADLRLRRDDVIYVPSNSERFVSVLGEVEHPGAIPLSYNATVASLLAMAGGITEKAGNKPRVEIVDPSTGTTRFMSFRDVLNPSKTAEVQLKPGEIIYVPQSGFYRATYYLERLNPLVTVATIAFYAGAL